MDVVIVLAVLLAVCICTYVAVFCWFRKKSEKGQKETESSSSNRNLPKITPATRSVPQNQSDHNNVGSGGMKIVDENTVHYFVQDDDKDFPRFTTPKKTHEEDLSTYAEVHDAILPSAKVISSKYYDDIYLNPVDTVPTSSAQVYESVELKPLQKIETRCEKEHQQLEKAVDGRSFKEEQCLKVGAVDPADSNNLYATTDLSGLNNTFGKTSIQHDAYEECNKGAVNEPPTTNGKQAYCSSLYATTDLSGLNNTFGKTSIKHDAYEECSKGAVNEPPTTNGKQAYCSSLYATTDLSESNKVFGKTSIKHDAHQKIKKGAINERRTTASKDANEEQTSCDSLYATTDLSKPNIVIKPSKQGQEEKRRRDGARAQPVCCDHLYATTALDAIAYEDELRRTQSFIVSTSIPSYSNNSYASSGLDLKDKSRKKGLEQDDTKESSRISHLLFNQEQ